MIFKIFNTPANIVTLRFKNKTLEHEFLQGYISKYLSQLRFAHLAAILFLAVVIPSELLLIKMKQWLIILKVALVVPSLILGFIITYIFTGFYKKHYQYLNIYYILITGISLILSGANVPDNFAFSLYCGLIICLLFNYIFIRLSFVKSSITGLIILIVFFLFAFHNIQSERLLTHLSIYMISTNIVGMFSAYTIEFEGRKSFLMLNQINRDTEEIKNANKNLEAQVKERTRELLKAKDKAEESDRLKSAFLANMSHEIRTPMNGILGFSDLLKTPKLSGEQQTQYIDIIQKSGTRMLNIINDLIDISKVESGLVVTSISNTNINDQLEYIFTFFKPEVERKNMQLFVNTSLDKKDSIIKTDREKLYAIIINLVKNAIKYSNSGTIIFGYEKKDNYLEFYVKDTGIGIPEKYHESIFNRFVQTNSSLSSGYEGAGLGLAITKAYVEILEGKIWVESEEEKGSIFYFTIPYNHDTEKKTIIETPIEQICEREQIKNLKILIVEDDMASELLVEAAVKEFSKEILVAKNGIEAVKKCQDNLDIDLILMDMRMPEMDGYEATKQIRKFNKNVIIIAQTAFALSNDREKTINVGCNDYIMKPINQVQLKNLITTLINNKNANRIPIKII
jgi:signal transduction histidine kinase/CheY-like chemotaxis protein